MRNTVIIIIFTAMKITAKKIDLYVGGIVINCHDAEIEIPDVADSMSEKIMNLKSIADEMKEISNIMNEAAESEPVGKTDKPKRKTDTHGGISDNFDSELKAHEKQSKIKSKNAEKYGVVHCEYCRQVFQKQTKKQRFCSTDCVRAYARRCKQPKGAQQMITGVKNDYAPFTPQP